MKNIAISLAAAALSACTVVPTGTANQACDLLQIALTEADMAEGWYIDAGQVLTRCGVPGAAALADRKACYARRFNDNSEVCE